MGALDKAVGYLSGAMEFVSDHGVQWRRKFITLSHEANLKIDYIDPTNKPGGEEIRIGENKEYQANLQRTGQWKKLQEYVHDYRRYDLRFTDYSDFIVIAIDPSNVAQWGTANETYIAEIEHKPRFFICEGGLYKFPRWLFDVAEPVDDLANGIRRNVFENVEQVIEELTLLDAEVFLLGKEWVLVRKFIEDSRGD